MNLLKLYIDSLPIEVPMKFGVNSNVILNHIDIKDHLTRKGDISPKNFFMEFLMLDDDGEPIAREEFSFFKLNGDKPDFLEMNFNDQFNKLLTLSMVMYEYDEEALEAKMEEVSEKLFGNSDGLTDMADELFAQNSKTLPKGKKLKAGAYKKAVEELNASLNEFFYEVLKDKVGLGTSPKMYLLSVIDKKGYKQLPDESDFVSLEDDLVVTEKYISRKAAAEKPDIEDEVGDDIGDDITDEVASVSDDEFGDLGDLDDFADDDEDDEEAVID